MIGLHRYWWDLGFGGSSQSQRDAEAKQKGGSSAPRPTPKQRTLMLGGEVSMWSDHYCEWDECQVEGSPAGTCEPGGLKGTLLALLVLLLHQTNVFTGND